MLACSASHMRFRWSHLCECMQNAFDKLRQTCVRSTDVLLHDSATTHGHRKQLCGPCTRLPNRLRKGSETVGVWQRWLHLQLNVRTQDAQLWVSRAEKSRMIAKYLWLNLFSIRINPSLFPFSISPTAPRSEPYKMCRWNDANHVCRDAERLPHAIKNDWPDL